MDIGDITLVDVKTSEESLNAIVNASIDAVVIGEPYASSARASLGSNATFWRVQSSQPLYALIVSTEEWIERHPEVVTKLLKSLASAEDYAIHNPAGARAIIQKRLGLDTTAVETVWSRNQFSLSLDESLIAAMEDEARWMIANNLTTEKQVPNFLNYIYLDGLKMVKPEAVDITR